MIVRAARAKLVSTERKLRLQGMDENGPVASILSHGNDRSAHSRLLLQLTSRISRHCVNDNQNTCSSCTLTVLGHSPNIQIIGAQLLYYVPIAKLCKRKIRRLRAHNSFFPRVISVQRCTLAHSRTSYSVKDSLSLAKVHGFIYFFFLDFREKRKSHSS